MVELEELHGVEGFTFLDLRLQPGDHLPGWYYIEVTTTGGATLAGVCRWPTFPILSELEALEWVRDVSLSPLRVGSPRSA